MTISDMRQGARHGDLRIAEGTEYLVPGCRRHMLRRLRFGCGNREPSARDVELAQQLLVIMELRDEAMQGRR